jgi:hypothetical protein
MQKEVDDELKKSEEEKEVYDDADVEEVDDELKKCEEKKLSWMGVEEVYAKKEEKGKKMGKCGKS